MKKRINKLHKYFNQLPKPVKAFIFSLVAALATALSLVLQGQSINEALTPTIGLIVGNLVYLANYFTNKAKE